MKIRCKKCGHVETVNKRFFIKAIGVGMSGAGFYAWVTYIFAGTGLAMPICIAIVAGGAALAAFSNEIAQWASKNVPCPKCGLLKWKVEE